MAPPVGGTEYTVHNVQLTGPIKRISDADYQHEQSSVRHGMLQL
jgi:hypothetical protein